MSRKILANFWNKIRYTAYVPLYGLVIRLLNKSRETSLLDIPWKGGEKVLIVGCGRGDDLPYLPTNTSITGIDITPLMIKKSQKKAKDLGLNAHFLVMSGDQLDFDDQTFDVVILNLILAVIPDPEACIKEVARILKDDGKVSIFDKFLADGKRPGMIRKILNAFTNLFFSNINRQAGPLIRLGGFVIEKEKPLLFKGFFKSYILKKSS